MFKKGIFIGCLVFCIGFSVRGQEVKEKEKIVFSAKVGYGITYNEASYLTSESKISTKVLDIHKFSPFQDKFWTFSVGAKYKNITLDIGYYSIRNVVIMDYTWTPYFSGFGYQSFTFKNEELGLAARTIKYYPVKLGYNFSILKGWISINPNLGVAIGRSNIHLVTDPSIKPEISSSKILTTNKVVAPKNTQANIQFGINLDIQLSKNGAHNLSLSGVLNRNTNYLYQTGYTYLEDDKKTILTYIIKNPGHFSFLTLSYKLNLL